MRRSFSVPRVRGGVGWGGVRGCVGGGWGKGVRG